MRQTTLWMAVAAMTTLGGCNMFGGGSNQPKPELVSQTQPTNTGGGGPAMTQMAPAETRPVATAPTTSIAGTGDKPQLPETQPAESYHLIIAAYSAKDIGKVPENASAAAKYLNEHGVPVTVMLPSAAGKPALIISTEGFASPKDGADFLAKVIEVGKKYPATPGGKAAFADAYFKKMKK